MDGHGQHAVGQSSLRALAFFEHDEEDGARPDRKDTQEPGVRCRPRSRSRQRDDVFGSSTDVRFDDGQSDGGHEDLRLRLDAVVLRQFVPEEDRDPNRTTKITTDAGTRRLQAPVEAGIGVHRRRAVRAHDQPRDRSRCRPSRRAPTSISTPLGVGSSYSLELPFDRTMFQAQQATRIGRHQLVGGALVFRQHKERRCHERSVFLDDGATRSRSTGDARRAITSIAATCATRSHIGRRVHATVGVGYDDVRYGDQFSGGTIDLVTVSPQRGVTVGSRRTRSCARRRSALSCRHLRFADRPGDGRRAS